MFFAPREGWRHLKVTGRRTAVDYAHALKDLADKHFPKVKKIVLVQDNPNTHKPPRFMKPSWPPRPDGVERFEWHYVALCLVTPHRLGYRAATPVMMD